MKSYTHPVEARYRDAPLPRITIPRLAEIPVPGLPPNPSQLGSMIEIPALVNFLDGSGSPDQARFWLAYDPQGLVMAGRLSKPTHGRTDVVEDQVQHEQLQIVLNPAPDKRRWYRIRLRPDRVMVIDAGGEGAPHGWWGKGGIIKQRIDEQGWSFAVRIPFSLLGSECPEPGAIWRMNIFRYLYKRQEDNSSWSVMYVGRIDIPERYGEVVFGGMGICGSVVDCDLSPGPNRSRFDLRNLGKTVSGIEVVASQSGRILARRRCSVEAGSRKLLELDFVLPDGGMVILSAEEEGGTTVARWPRGTGCAVLGPRIVELHRKLGELTRSRSAIIAGQARGLCAELTEVEKALATAERNAGRWQDTECHLTQMERSVAMLAHRSRLPDQSAPAAILGTNSLVKIYTELPLPDALSKRIDLKAPRGGSDSAQLILIAFDQDLTDCIARVRPLSGPGGSTIGPEAVETWRVGYVTTRRPRYIVEYIGPHPDPLLPLESFSVGKGGFEVLWMTISVPRSAAAGTYEGIVEIVHSGKECLRMPVALRVWDFDLPARPSLRTAFPIFEKEIEDFYGRPLTPRQRWLYYDFLLRRHISPSCQYEEEPRPRIEDMDGVMNAGSNVISMGYLPKEKVDEWVDGLRPTVEFLRRRGWLKWAYVYGFDEVIPAGYPELKEAYRKVKEAYPDLPRGCTVGPEHELPEIFGTVDIWIPQTDRFDSAYEERQALGEEVWWYVSMWPRHPFANMFVDYPAIDHRILLWQTWKYGVTGFLYYCINLWSSNCVGLASMEREGAALPDPRDRQAIESGARWPEVPWNTYTGPTATNGDGQLIYPGPDGGPLSSVRLECVRHGIEDFEMLSMLRRQAEKLSVDLGARASGLVEEAIALIAVPPEVCIDLTRYTQDPSVLLRARERIGDLLERMMTEWVHPSDCG